MGPTLYQFFHRHIQHGFRQAGLAEPATVDYVADILSRFAQTSAVYPIRDHNQRHLTTLTQFLTELRLAQEQDRARAALIIRHLGEYSLFMSGFFRERLRARGQLAYYVDHGRSAFGQSADLESDHRQARVFWRLQRDFPRVALALDTIRQRQLPLAAGTLTEPAAALWRM
ncbi:MAG: hypothetical protein M0Z76_09700 [Gammaproteobacteria bacterium]|nr:hypothetical protein [Gammaproteobacteria bacterium]